MWLDQLPRPFPCGAPPLGAPRLLFKDAPLAPKRLAPGSADEPHDSDQGRFIRCAACGQPVSSARSRALIGGSHAHVFANPGGFVFEIGCFADAFGCRGEGPFVAEFSWFDGFAWQVAVCRACEAHLGWRFRPLSGASAGFWGLILARLSEEE